MLTLEVRVRRVSVLSSRSFEEVVCRLTENIGRPDMHGFQQALGAAKTAAELEAVVQGAVGASELMEFARFDAGEVLRKERGGQAPHLLRLLVGNPIIMKSMARTVPDAASYAPVTILIAARGWRAPVV